MKNIKLEPINNSINENEKTKLTDSTQSKKSYIIRTKNYITKGNEGIPINNENNNIEDFKLDESVKSINNINENISVLFDDIKVNLNKMKDTELNGKKIINIPDNIKSYIEEINSSLNESRNYNFPKDNNYNWYDEFQKKIKKIKIDKNNNSIIENKSIAEIKRWDNLIKEKEKDVKINRESLLSNISKECYNNLKEKLYFTDINKSANKGNNDSSINETIIAESKELKDLKDFNANSIKNNLEIKKNFKKNKKNFIEYNKNSIGLDEEKKLILKLNEIELSKYNKLKNNLSNFNYKKKIENLNNKVKKIYNKDNYYLYNEDDNKPKNKKVSSYLETSKRVNIIKSIDKRLKELKVDGIYNNKSINFILSRKINFIYEEHILLEKIKEIKKEIDNYEIYNYEDIKINKFNIEEIDKEAYNTINNKINSLNNESDLLNSEINNIEIKFNNETMNGVNFNDIEENLNEVENIVEDNKKIIEQLNSLKTKEYEEILFE